MGRQPNRRPSIYHGADGWWHCYVTVGTRADGRPDRRHVKRSTAGKVADAVADLEARVRGGERIPAQAGTVAEWLGWWLDNIVAKRREPKTYEAYRAIIRHHLVPRIGRYRLDGGRKVLTPEAVEACYADLAGHLAPSYVLQCHRVLRRALKIAVRFGRASRNVADLVDAPSVRSRRIRSLDLAAVKAIIAASADDPMGLRWLIAIVLGLRQGETLGLRWADVHLDDPPHIATSQQAQRRTWRHGCKDPVACAREHCRTRPCASWDHGCGGTCGKGAPHWCPQRRPAACRRHTRACPPPCPPGCTDHARLCPARVGGGVVLKDLKTEGSERTIPLDAAMVRGLREHRRAQAAARLAAGAAWTDRDLVFCGPVGQPIDPRRDHERWEQLLQRAGLPDARLHAARHTAATLLHATGTETAVVQEILGHTDIRTTRRYQDVASELKAQAVERLASSLFGGGLDGLVQPSAATPHRRR